ncbi:MAG: amidohydrolase family protein [Burkholderiaceae bacterium]|jgi:imidazolonepropionase-like amidohydrolase/Tol biopolymer transport system component
MPAPISRRSLSVLATAALVCLQALAVDAPAPASEASAPAKAKWDVNHPPGPKATVDIDTRTGTWMSVDVSPDGQRLVVDLLGDLYTLPIAGGDATPLTHSIAWEMQARWSPDGKRIAFISDAGGGDNVWVMNADGSDAKAVTKEDFRLLYTPTWSPDGQYIAARKHFTGSRSLGSGEIWLYHAGGAGKGVQLNEKPNWQKDLGEPAFSPDGRYVYYSQDTTDGTQFEYNKDSNGEIFSIQRLDLHDGSTEPFVTGQGGAVRPEPSPDGKQLAFVRRVRNQSTLFLKDLATGQETPVWGHLERDMQEAWSVQGVYPGFAWTPDSKTIVVWAQGKLWRVDPFKRSAAEIAFHVKDTREITPALRVPVAVAPSTFDVKQLRWMNVSPQGDRVVYSALGYLYVKDLPNGAAHRLTSQTAHFEYFPRFSRDGREIVFTTWNDKDLGSVRRIAASGGAETTLTTEPGQYTEPQFSPDGRTVVYVKGKGGYLTSPWHGLDTGVYRLAADGKSVPERLTKNGRTPQFGATNDAVYVTRGGVQKEVDFNSKLVRIDLVDRKETDVATSEFVSQFAVSPDGRWLAFQEREHAYVTPLPLASKPIAVGAKMDALPVRQLDVDAGEYLSWSGDSTRVHFGLGERLFTSELRNAFMFVPGAPKELPKADAAGVRVGFVEASDRPAGTIAITGARIVTMKGDEVIADGTIVIDGNRITAVGPTDRILVPAGAKMIEAHGKTIIPGIVDVHWHGGMADNGIVPQQSWINYASLAFGVTTLHDPSNNSSQVFTASEMQRAGIITGPRIFSTGTILYGAKAPITQPIDSLEDALNALKRQKALGAISVKSYNQPRREQRQQVLEAARQTDMMVVPEGGSLFELNMTMVVDGHTGVEHALPVENAYDDVKQLWGQTQVGYTPTYNVAYGGLDGEHYFYATTEVWKHPILKNFVPRSVLEERSVRREIAPEEDYNVIRVAKTAAGLLHAGVRENLGAHGQREGLGAHWDMWMQVMGGMTPLEAIRNSTINGAHYLGMDADIGSLEVGKLADLVIIDGDPTTDIRQSDRVVDVMQNGRLYSLPRLDEIAPRQKARQPFFFDGADGAAMPVSTRGRGHGDMDGDD